MTHKDARAAIELLEQATDTLGDMHEGGECKSYGGEGCLACEVQAVIGHVLVLLRRSARRAEPEEPQKGREP